jgi:hypothetical protein
MSDQDTTQVVSQPVDGTAPATDAPQLNIQDLQNLRAIVDLAMRRGAFGAAEATSVGQVFDRVNAFLNAVAPQDQTPAPQQ